MTVLSFGNYEVGQQQQIEQLLLELRNYISSVILWIEESVLRFHASSTVVWDLIRPHACVIFGSGIPGCRTFKSHRFIAVLK